MRCRVIKVQIGQFWADGVKTQALKSITSGRVQPDLWMICVAAQMPHLTAVRRSLPRTYWARKPPTKASPAPFVSTILLAGSFSAGNSTTVPFSAQTTGSEPWVMITVLPLLPFSLGSIEMASADDGVRALGDDHSPSLAAVLFGQHRDGQRDLLYVSGAEVEGVSKCGGLCLVSKDNVSIRHDRHHLVLEELDQEGRGEVEAVGPVVGSTVLANLEHGVD